ncbi:hypothetical protein ACP275_04G161900 [Erythranthe tilingii]
MDLPSTSSQGGDDEIVRSKKLKGRQYAVWFVQFSHNGKYLAAVCGRVLDIWEILDCGGSLLYCRFESHAQRVSYITWKPNELQLLTCAENVKWWTVAPTPGRKYVLLRTYEKQCLCTVLCVWAPDGKHIFTGFNDVSISMWNLQGREVRSWQGGYTTRIADLAISLDGEELISTYRYDKILLFKWRTEARRYIDEFEHIVSFTLSKDGYVLRACFVGPDEELIASGSEDSMIYLWHRETGELIRTLERHSAVVNCVCSNPARPDEIASGSDDRLIITWR